MTEEEIYRLGFKNGASYFDKLRPDIDRPEDFDKFTEEWWNKDVWTGEEFTEKELKARFDWMENETV